MTDQHSTVLITGIAGFIGRYVSRYFKQQGWQVVGLDTAHAENAPVANTIAYYTLKLPDQTLGTIIQHHQPDVLIHCAGRASVGLSITEPSIDFYSNAVVTFEVLQTLRTWAPQCKFIYLSSAAVYGNPTQLPISEDQPPAPLSPYGFHKLQGEQLALEFHRVYGLPTASVRIFSAYGPGLRRQVMWDICRKSATQTVIELQGTGNESRDFVHALDIAQALLVVTSSAPMTGEFYNLATGQEITIANLAKRLLHALESNQNIRFDGVVPIGNPLNWKADISKICALGFMPSVPFEQGVSIFAAWCRAELIGV